VPTTGQHRSASLFGTAAASRREWMLGDTVVSVSPVITTTGALIFP